MRKEDERSELIAWVTEQFGVETEHPFRVAPAYEVFRHPDNKKWFALLMGVPREKLGVGGTGIAEVVIVKCDPLLYGSLIRLPGIQPSYHMSKGGWITVLLDGTVEKDMLHYLIDQSWQLTDGRKEQKPRLRRISVWLVPANPKYYDVEEAFEKEKEILWKQSSDVRVGDTVYLYVGAPFSAIRFQCRATHVNIPYRYEDSNVRMKKAMKIRLERKFDSVPIDRAMLARHGVQNVRGPRSMPESLAKEIDELYPAR